MTLETAIAMAGLVLALISAVGSWAFVLGSFKQFKTDTERRLDVLEQADDHSITREEMDARFNEVKSELKAMNKRLDDFVSLTRELMKQ